MSNETDKLESRICPYCEKPSLIVHIDRWKDKWVICQEKICYFEAFLEYGTTSPEGFQFIKDMEEQNG